MASSSSPPPPPPRLRLENPVSLKVLQVFTGFGIGCGMGVGVGRPIHLGAIPALREVLSAASGATDAFSGIGRHTNYMLRKVGLRNIEAGVGCGVGFGYGFGVGVALKPRVIQGIQSSIDEIMATIMTKLKDIPALPSAPILISSLPSSLTMNNHTSDSSSEASKLCETNGDIHSDNVSHEPSDQRSRLQEKQSVRQSYMSTSKESLDLDLLKNRQRDANLKDAQTEGMVNVLQTLIKHQQGIEDLREENQVLRDILIQDLHISPSKLKLDNRIRIEMYIPCSDCFECRRKNRRSTK